MSGTQKKTDRLNIKGLASQQEKNFVNASGRNILLPVEGGYEYLTGVVIDVISNPRIYFGDQNRQKSIKETLSGDDQKFSMIEKTPKNSIVCQIIDLGQSEYNNVQIICFPFFPPHFSLPVKPGEHVWIVKETTGDISRYYWMCRKHSAYHVDNLNLNVHEREVGIYDSIEQFKKDKTKIDHEIARISNFDFPNFLRSGVGIPSLDLEKIADSSYAFNFLTTEPVPDLTKNCSDLLLQGSNNSIIHLTQEKFTPLTSENSIERQPPESFSGTTETNKIKQIRQPLSPAIDICIARKKKELEVAKSLARLRNSEDDYQNEIGEPVSSIGATDVESEGMHFIKNHRSDPSKSSYEINKMPEYIDGLESDYNILQDYDVDIKNCGSRIYLSNNCDIDDVFNVGSEGDSDIIFNRFGGATFSAYSQHTRLISDGTFRVVNSFETEESSGSTYIEIDDTGLVSIGSLRGDVASEGDVAGMQPFVKGGELEILLQRLIDEITGMIQSINDNFQTNSSPGFGGPNLVLSAILPPILTSHKINFEEVREDLNKFKSTLIRGE